MNFNINQLIDLKKPFNTIEILKNGRDKELPDVNKIKKTFDPLQHDIVIDKINKPDKRINYTDENEKEMTDIVKVARLPVTFQELITTRAVSFAFGNPIVIDADPQNKNEEMVVKALKKILHDTKSDALNIDVGRSLFGFTEVAELWYPEEKNNNRYGFNSNFVLKVQLLLPENGEKLYPYFDERKNMTAFSREFSIKDLNNNTIIYFETYTDEKIYRWKNSKANWELEKGYPVNNILGKIPIVYTYQDKPDYYIANTLIDRFENCISNLADKNDYHASPTTVVKGKIVGSGKKGDSSRVLELEENAEAKLLEWNQASESVELELSNLKNLIYSLTQTPDISFDSVKGLGNLSGIAIKLLFMDAHTKVMSKKGNLIAYLQRRINIITSFIEKFNLQLSEACQTVIIKPDIEPYIIQDDTEKTNMLLAANGNKPLVSQQLSTHLAGFTSDPDSDYDQIIKEQKEMVYNDVFEPTE